MKNGETKPVSTLVKDDEVATHNGGTAKVLCIIKTAIKNGTTKLCDLDGLQITPGHPVQHNGQWVYPRNIVEPKISDCAVVYNMVLD